MSISIVENFQKNIYSLLLTDHEIGSSIDKIYLSIVQDAKYPFLLINILKINDRSRFNHGIYEIEFEICLFTNNKSQNILTNLVSKIISKIKQLNIEVEGYVIAGINTGEISIIQSQDLVTTKLSIHYKALLKEKV